MASQARVSRSADLLPSLGDAVWDTSASVTEDSVLGKPSYVDRLCLAADGVQIVFYLGALFSIWLLPHGRPADATTPGGSLHRGAAGRDATGRHFLFGTLGAGSIPMPS